MEAVADDLAGAADGNEGGRLVDTDEIAEFDGLRTAHDGDDDGFLFLFITADRLVSGDPAFELMENKLGDRLRIVADDGEYLAEVDVFDQMHIIPNSKISSEIQKDGVVIYEE